MDHSSGDEIDSCEKNNATKVFLVFFCRWWNADLWSTFFTSFLNIADCDSLPDVTATRNKMEEYFYAKYYANFGMAAAELNCLIRR